MNANIQKALEIWHKHYEDEENQYSEFEHSDIEYFVGCMLYNRFAFSKAVPTMKTMDLSYDFLSSCGDVNYEEVQQLINSIRFDDEKDAVRFLLEYVETSRSKYKSYELYLLDRLYKHISLLFQRYKQGVEPTTVDFQRIKFHG